MIFSSEAISYSQSWNFSNTTTPYSSLQKCDINLVSLGLLRGAEEERRQRSGDLLGLAVVKQESRAICKLKTANKDFHDPSKTHRVTWLFSEVKKKSVYSLKEENQAQGKEFG